MKTTLYQFHAFEALFENIISKIVCPVKWIKKREQRSACIIKAYTKTILKGIRKFGMVTWL